MRFARGRGGIVVNATEIRGLEQWETLKRSGVVREEHAVLASGLHTGEVIHADVTKQWHLRWFMDEVFQYLEQSTRGLEFDVMVGVPHGADHFVEYITSMLHRRQPYETHVRPVKIEKGLGGMVVPEGAIRPGERVLVLEDTLTTGGSLENACQALVAAGAVIAGKFTIFNRSSRDGLAEEQGVQYFIRHAIADHDPTTCPLCAKGVPLVDPNAA